MTRTEMEMLNNTKTREQLENLDGPHNGVRFNKETGLLEVDDTRWMTDEEGNIVPKPDPDLQAEPDMNGRVPHVADGVIKGKESGTAPGYEEE